MLLLFLYWRFRRSERQLGMQPDEASTGDSEDEMNSSELDALVPLLIANKKFVHSRNRKAFHRLLCRAERRRRCRKIPRSSLQPPCDSSWNTLYDGNDDAAMITLTGLDFAVFDELHTKFKPYFDKLSPHSKNGLIRALQESPKRRGRKRILCSKLGLGLTLAWTRTRGSCFVLSMIFGLTGTAVTVYVKFGRRVLIWILEKDKDAKVSISSDAKIETYKQSVLDRHPRL